MDKKKEILANEEIKRDVKSLVMTAVGKTQKCNKCKKDKQESEFCRDGKTMKTCNKCNEKYQPSKSDKKVKIIDMGVGKVKILDKGGIDKALDDMNTQDDKELSNLISSELNSNPELAQMKIEKTAATAEKQVDEKLLQTPIERIQALEKLCGLPETKDDDYVKKSDNEKVEYQKLLITKMSKLYENKMNPLSWLLLMGAGVIEKNDYVLKNAGLEVNLEGYQKELYSVKPDLDAVTLEIMTESPEYIKYITNPYVKLSIIMTQCGLNVAMKNASKKTEQTASAGSNNIH